MKKRRVWKIAAGLLALALIGGLLFIVTSFYGNPISAAVVTSKVKTYVDETYPDMQLDVGRARYNFKFGEYSCMVSSPTSQDTVFAVSYRDGTFYDQYESEVEGRFSTYRRLNEEFNKTVSEIIEMNYAGELELVLATLGDDTSDFSSLELDMDLNLLDPPLDAALTVWAVEDGADEKRIAEELEHLKRVMDICGIPIDTYTLVIRQPEDKRDETGIASIGVYDFPAEEIGSEGFLEKIRENIEAMENDEIKAEETVVA